MTPVVLPREDEAAGAALKRYLLTREAPASSPPC
jgi:hypothetical protein